jgi:hypothetical protein
MPSSAHRHPQQTSQPRYADIVLPMLLAAGRADDEHAA